MPTSDSKWNALILFFLWCDLYCIIPVNYKQLNLGLFLLIITFSILFPKILPYPILFSKILPSLKYFQKYCGCICNHICNYKSWFQVSDFKCHFRPHIWNRYIYISIPNMRSKMTFENWNLKSGIQLHIWLHMGCIQLILL